MRSGFTIRKASRRCCAPQHHAGRVVVLAGLLTLAAHWPAASADRELGRHLSAECLACHQLTGRSTGGVPAIVGVPPGDFIAQMQAYRTGQRQHQIMQAIALRLSEEDIAALAQYFHDVGPK